MRDDGGSDQSSVNSSGEKCSAYILKVESIRISKQKMRKIRLLFGLRNWKDRLAMEKIKEERLVYLLV